MISASLGKTDQSDYCCKNTTYALAELIDNSIQADATHIEILCCDKNVVGVQNHREIHQIAVLDNGKGMNSRELKMALQFGNGTHQYDRSEIVHFGMGLLDSSISQCKRVEVWTWQCDRTSPIYSYLDVDETEKWMLTTSPDPELASFPGIWYQAAHTIGGSGTLVVWSKLDRCMWENAETMIPKSEYVLGRIFRKYIAEALTPGDFVRIRLANFVESSPSSPDTDIHVRVNDPIYLTSPSSTPPPFHDKAMFCHTGDEWEITSTIEYKGRKHEVHTRFTTASDEAIAHEKAVEGKPYVPWITRHMNNRNIPHGKHAEGNVGISLLRARREIELNTSLISEYEYRERWWGVELEFPPSLDEVFGVTSNMQSARNFSDVAYYIKSIHSDRAKLEEFARTLRRNEDPREHLIPIIRQIDRTIEGMRKMLLSRVERISPDDLDR